MKIQAPLSTPWSACNIAIHAVPPPLCTYTCRYCQRSPSPQIPFDRQPISDPQEIIKTVGIKVRELRSRGHSVDYLVFTPPGEPLVDLNLGYIIERLEPLGVKIAIITNASFIWQVSVQRDLKLADRICLKVDAVEESIWRAVNCPHRSKYLLPILEGMLDFASHYRKKLMTHTTLVAGVNDSETHIIKLANFLTRLKPEIAYLSVMTQADKGAFALQHFKEKLPTVELLDESHRSLFHCAAVMEF